MGPSGPAIHVSASTGSGRHQLAGGVGHPLRGHPAQGLGWQPDLGGGVGASRADVGVADLLAAGALCPGLAQSTAAGHAGSLGTAALIDRTNLRGSKDSFARAYPLIRCVDCELLFESGGRMPRPVLRLCLPPPRDAACRSVVSGIVLWHAVVLGSWRPSTRRIASSIPSRRDRGGVAMS